jgi:hypothetical protein
MRTIIKYGMIVMLILISSLTLLNPGISAAIKRITAVWGPIETAMHSTSPNINLRSEPAILEDTTGDIHTKADHGGLVMGNVYARMFGRWDSSIGMTNGSEWRLI